MDDLDRSIARRTAKNPRYPEMLQAEVRRQRLIAALIAERKANHLTQAQVAAEMNVSQSVVAEIESSKADVRYSTLDRYAEAVTKHKKRDSGHGNLNAGGHLAERSRPRELHNRGHEICTPSR
jgi:transcriptional regulator with XRE-family HTH domain